MKKKIISLINEYNLDLIVLAGFKRILSPFLLANFKIKLLIFILHYYQHLPVFMPLDKPWNMELNSQVVQSILLMME